MGRRKLRSFRGVSPGPDSAVYDFDLEATLDTLVIDSSDTSLYDPLTIESFRRLQDDLQPYWSSDEVDPYRSRRVGEKALAMQAGRTFNSVLNTSEMGPAYRSLKRGLVNLSDMFRYSLQTDGDEMHLDKVSRGKKLLELNLEFNVKKGIDPQLRIGEDFRLRYDYIYKRTMLEYGIEY